MKACADVTNQKYFVRLAPENLTINKSDYMEFIRARSSAKPIVDGTEQPQPTLKKVSE